MVFGTDLAGPSWEPPTDVPRLVNTRAWCGAVDEVDEVDGVAGAPTIVAAADRAAAAFASPSGVNVDITFALGAGTDVANTRSA